MDQHVLVIIKVIKKKLFCSILSLKFIAGAPNYYPNSFSGPIHNEKYLESAFEVKGNVDRYNTRDDDNFTQVGIFWNKVLNEEERNRLAKNIADHLGGASDFIQNRTIENFRKCDPEYGQRIFDFLNKKVRFFVFF